MILISYEKVNRYDIKKNSEKNIQVKIIKSMVLEVEGQSDEIKEKWNWNIMWFYRYHSSTILRYWNIHKHENFEFICGSTQEKYSHKFKINRWKSETKEIIKIRRTIERHAIQHKIFRKKSLKPVTIHLSFTHTRSRHSTTFNEKCLVS